jgi:hypothetical protein
MSLTQTRDYPRNATRLGRPDRHFGGLLAVLLSMAWLWVDVTMAPGQQVAYAYVLPAQTGAGASPALDAGRQMPASEQAPEILSAGPPPCADLGQPPPSVQTFDGSAPAGVGPMLVPGGDFWSWQVLPDGLIYHSYLAGVKEPRLGTVWNYVKGYGWMWDSTLGGRMGVLRYGTQDGVRPEGWQIDVEGAAFPELDLEQDRNLAAVDFRAGVPLTYGFDRYQGKFGYYHLCSHVGDEYLLLFPALQRTNYTRDAIIWGNAYYLTDDLRIYGEASWAFHTWGDAKPWEFQIGAEYSPVGHAGDLSGSPFLAVDAEFRQDVNYEATLVVQAGWQWRGVNNHLFRTGAQFYTGKSEMLQFLYTNERKVGAGIWYDY